jgi:hypothetical protein
MSLNGAREARNRFLRGLGFNFDDSFKISGAFPIEMSTVRTGMEVGRTGVGNHIRSELITSGSVP